MTAEQLINHLNYTYGAQNEPWPKRMDVSAETYASCCNYVFKSFELHHTNYLSFFVEIYLGPNKGLMFKGIELIPILIGEQ